MVRDANPIKISPAIYPPANSSIPRLSANRAIGATSRGPTIAPKVPPSTTFAIAPPRFVGGLTSAAAKRPKSIADWANPTNNIPPSMSSSRLWLAAITIKADPSAPKINPNAIPILRPNLSIRIPQTGAARALPTRRIAGGKPAQRAPPNLAPKIALTGAPAR